MLIDVAVFFVASLMLWYEAPGKIAGLIQFVKPLSHPSSVGRATDS